MDWPRHIVAVTGLFRDEEGRILLVKTERRGWECPGGQVELGEDLVAALVREAAEESGCAVSVEALVGIYSNTQPPEKVQFMFTGRLRAGHPTPDHVETLAAGLYTPAEALELVTAPPMRVRLQDALNGSPRPVYRVYHSRPYQAIAHWEV